MATTVNKIVRQFSDLDLNFLAHPVTGDVVKSFDEDSINKNIRYLILTVNYESPFHPEKGCQINNMLFEMLDPLSIQVMKRTIENSINNFEPRVNLLETIVTPNYDQNSINVVINYEIINSSQPVTFSMTLKRTR